MRVLICSDTKIYARILENFVRNSGMEATCCEFLEILTRPPEDAVILVDWAHVELGFDEKYHAVAHLFQKLDYRLFIVVPTADEAARVCELFPGRDEQLIHQAEDVTVYREKLGSVRKIFYSRMKIDARFVNAFVQALSSSYETFAGEAPTRQKVHVVEEAPNHFEVSALIGFSGTYQGSVVVSFPRSLALSLAAQTSGETPENLATPSVADAISEFMNVFAAHAQGQLEDTDFDFDLGLPTVLLGRKESIHSSEEAPTFRVPFTASEQDFELQLKVRPTVLASSKPQGRALIVEDDPTIARVIESAVDSIGFQVKTVKNGFLAGAALENYLPELMTLDLNMPGISGLEVLHYVKSEERFAGVKVIVVSGGSDDELEQTLELGADSYLKKPASKAQLVAKMRDILNLEEEAQPTKTEAPC